MKKLVLLLLFMFALSCTVNTTTTRPPTKKEPIPCWRDRLCVGDTYRFNRAPRPGGGVHITVVQVINFRNNYVLIRQSNGREDWVRTTHLEKYSTPVRVHVKQKPGKGEPNRGQGQGRGRGNK